MSLYNRLIADLNSAGALYRLIDRYPEGRTEPASALRGHDLAHAAKSLVVRVKITKKENRYALAVIPGNARLDLLAVKCLLGGTRAAFADRSTAEKLAGSMSGTLLPFSYHPQLELIADPALLAGPEIYFNAARLDRSIAMATDDYLRIASPRIEPVSAAAVAVQ